MSVFKLQQFSVQQSASAMKVCTDSLIFGAMAPIKAQDNVLDIGAGTGLLSLMAMQLGAAKVTAIELTSVAAQEAKFNVVNSPWPAKITVIEQNIVDYAAKYLHENINVSASGFDLIISNPPFFNNHLKNKDKLRNTARHTDTLSFEDLLRVCGELLNSAGRCYLLVPVAQIEHIVALAKRNQLQLCHQRYLITLVDGKAKLATLTFSKSLQPQILQSQTQPIIEQHTIYAAHQQYTAQSAAYLGRFLLRFAD